MLHLTKLAVGVRDIAHLRALQAARTPPLRHRTRNQPRRRAEVIDGGSIYWVIQGATLVRQRILDIVDDRHEDGSACAALILDPDLVPVAARPTKPFQGWRYLSAEAAPADLSVARDVPGEAALPPPLRAALRELCLL